MDANTAGVITDAIKILGPALIAAVVAYRSARAQYNIERLRLHDKERTAAYKEAFLFARRLRNRVFPLATDKRNVFIKTMGQEYFGKLDKEAVYFGAEISDILDRLESEYICMTDPDLIPEMDPKEEENFLEHKLFDLVEKLVTHVRKTMRESGISA